MLAPKVVTKTAPWLRKATMGVISTEPAVLDTAPKIDAISEVLPITNLARLGDKCYLRALLSSGAPASTFGLPVRTPPAASRLALPHPDARHHLAGGRSKACAVLLLTPPRLCCGACCRWWRR